jgi:hypothetical protein
MAFTKNQMLTFLANKRDAQPHNTTTPSESSIKYYTIGTLHLLLQNDIITVAQVAAEFPELG